MRTFVNWGSQAQSAKFKLLWVSRVPLPISPPPCLLLNALLGIQVYLTIHYLHLLFFHCKLTEVSRARKMIEMRGIPYKLSIEYQIRPDFTRSIPVETEKMVIIEWPGPGHSMILQQIPSRFSQSFRQRNVSVSPVTIFSNSRSIMYQGCGDCGQTNLLLKLCKIVKTWPERTKPQQ